MHFMAKNIENPSVYTELQRGQYHIPFYMSMQCENLLKKFLILSASKRSMYGKIMKDQWMNVSPKDHVRLPPD